MITLLLRRMIMVLSLVAPLMLVPDRARARDAVTVFAAASLKTALDEIVALYAGSGGDVRLSFGGSSTLAWQIQYGAQADVFLSANAVWMDVLQEEGLIEPETRVDLLSNQLVLITEAAAPLDLTIGKGFDLSGALKQGHLAMALVDAVPAGLYGRAALQSLGVWVSVQPRIAQADNVRAALMLVARGEAPLGIVYATDARSEPRVRVVDVFPSGSHPQIRYPAAIVTGATEPSAQRFLNYLSGPQAREVFREHGFGVFGDGA